MPLYVPDPDNLATAADLIEQLGADLASRYAAAEDELIREIAKRAYRDLTLQGLLARAIARAEDTQTLRDRIAQNRALAELAAYRAQTIRELQFLAIEVAEKLRAANLAEAIIDIAAAEGEAAAAAQLRMAKRLPFTTSLTASSSQAVAALTLDLGSRLEAMNWRITRYPEDAYQRIISFTAPRTILGVQTSHVSQAQAVQQFLSEGITGFVDKSDRHWRIGTYAEMAGRTAVRRAYEDAGVWRMQQSGVNLGIIVGAVDACKHCAPWIGKIVSLDGSTGTVTVPHSTRDETVTVVIYGTLDQAKAARWGHPNCRDRVVAYLPGLTIPQAEVEYSPEAEAERAQQREIERNIRAAKRDAATAGDDVTRKRAEREVRELQAEMRDFTERTGRNRSNYREQLHFADGKGGRPRPNGVSGSMRTPPKNPSGIDIQIKRGTPLGNDVRAARSSIASVHSIPKSAGHLPVQSALLGPGTNGMYRGGQGLMQMSPNGQSPRLTFAHETGHFLDHKVLGNSTRNLEARMLANPLTEEWLAAARGSESFRNLAAMRADVAFAEMHGHIDYLMSPVELWGRSYAQFIATRSADTVMLAEVAAYRSSENLWTANRQWGKTDFEGISPYIEAILREKGLL